MDLATKETWQAHHKRCQTGSQTLEKMPALQNVLTKNSDKSSTQYKKGMTMSEIIQLFVVDLVLDYTSTP